MTDQTIYARQPAENRPNCPYCHELCIAGSTSGGITRYYCKNQSCGITYSVKVPRPDIREIQRQEAAGTEFDPRK